MSAASESECGHTETVAIYVLRALPPGELAAMEEHLATCAACRQELNSLAPVADSLTSWPTDLLRPARPLWERLAERIASETGSLPNIPSSAPRFVPEWEEVAPGIFCKLLATDATHDRVSMLVRLAPGVAYPPHLHAGVEELHLLDGELWIEDRKLLPGDYNRAEPGTGDTRVWSETGCTCVLITSTQDAIR